MNSMKPARPSSRGFTLLEMLVAIGILFVMFAVALPALAAYRDESALIGAARTFRSEFIKARSVAVAKNTQTAIRFEKDADGRTFYATYIDGNFNGVLSADIQTGADTRISGPFLLDSRTGPVSVEVIPGVAGPDGTPLGLEPIRFGNSRMVSFSTTGTGTPGTFYLRSRNTMAGVRVTGGSARVRIMILRGKRWVDRQG